jgi:hypothetical protein
VEAAVLAALKRCKGGSAAILQIHMRYACRYSTQVTRLPLQKSFSSWNESEAEDSKSRVSVKAALTAAMCKTQRYAGHYNLQGPQARLLRIRKKLRSVYRVILRRHHQKDGAQRT